MSTNLKNLHRLKFLSLEILTAALYITDCGRTILLCTQTEWFMTQTCHYIHNCHVGLSCSFKCVITTPPIAKIL